MIYPLTERRITGIDRRTNIPGSEGDESWQSIERRLRGERRQLMLDRKKLLSSIIA